MIKLLFVIGICFLSLACGGGETVNVNGTQVNVPKPTFNGVMDCRKRITSPKGVTICSGSSIAANVPGIVDGQLNDLFTIAQNGATTASGVNNYHKCASGAYEPTHNCFSTWATYFVWLIPRADACVNPGFTEMVYSDPWPNGYDETYSDAPANHWDKDPRAGHTLLCVSGFMATGGGQNKGLALPGMGVVDAVETMPIVRYEGEHCILAQVDTNRYAATQYHYGANGGHPVLGEMIGSMKLVSGPALPEAPRSMTVGDRTLLLTK